MVILEFKLINHRLLIESVRQKSIQSDKKICELCDLKDLRDEFYNVIRCKFMAIEKQKYVDYQNIIKLNEVMNMTK